MDLLSIILLAVGLAMDCFAVSVVKGLTTRKQPMWGWAVLMAVLFGLFQGGMPLIGFYAGSVWEEFFNKWSHWIALILLGTIGSKMLVDGINDMKHKKEGREQGKEGRPFHVGGLLLLAVATSIDALATGVLFIPAPEVLWLAVTVIAAVSLLFSLIGYLSGVYLGNRMKLNANIIGGLILIGIGLKIFMEHYIV